MSRLKLQTKLEELFESRNVYFQPPTSKEMSYPAIRYNYKKPDVKRASDRLYSLMNCYEVIVIDKRPDNPVIKKLLELPYCSYDRHYESNNLHHDVFTIYY